MNVLFSLAVVAVIVAAIWLSARANEIFFVSVRNGRCLVVRGRISGNLLEAIGDVIRRAGVVNGSVRAVRGEHHARIVTSGIDEGTTQRLRNVFGHHPAQKLRGAPIATQRNLGQMLGIAWLAWLLASVASSGRDG